MKIAVIGAGPAGLTTAYYTAAEGIDVDQYIESGALVVLTKKDTCLKEGCFDPDLMIAFLKESVRTAKSAGFSALRVTAEMTWALGDEPGTEKLIEYEAKLNRLPENI